MDKELMTKFELFLFKELEENFQGLVNQYIWPVKNGKDANKTIADRLKRSSKFNHCTAKDRQQKILKEYLNIWGGMHLSDKTINAYVKCLDNANKLESLADRGGISSKSKALSLFKPKEYFIYDSYVAIALNYFWLICKDTKKCPCPFPTCQSRRRVVQIVEHHFNSYPKSSQTDFYSASYIPLIKTKEKKLGEKGSPEKVEMALFVKGRKIIEEIEPKIDESIMIILKNYLNNSK